MADIRINDLPPENSPTASEVVAIDGANTRKTTIQSLVNAGAPIASQAEAQAGTDASKRMTPLTTKQSIASEIGVTLASAAQGALAAAALPKNEKPDYANLASFTSSSISASVSAIRTYGYYTPGDGGESVYARLSSTPSPIQPWHKQSADGAWWQLVIEDYISPLHFGSTATAGVDSSDSFSAMVGYSQYFGVRMSLPGGGRVYEKAGRTLVHNNFNLEVCKGATLKRTGSDGYIFINTDGTRSGGYDGCKNVKITVDGIIDCGRSGTSVTTAFWVGAHQDGLHICGDGEITNSYGSHVMEINSTRRCLIENIKITDRLYPASGNYEAIQIDYSNESGYPANGPYDDTPCDDVTVRNVYFDGGHSGVGSHSSPPTAHKNIKIVQCIFNAPAAYGIRPQRWKDSFVIFNTVISAGTRGILSWACDNTQLAFNYILGGCSDFGIQVSQDTSLNLPVNVRSTFNSVFNVSGVGIYISNGSGHSVEESLIIDSGQEAINVSSSSVTNTSVSINRVFGASASSNSSYSAVRITGVGCSIKTNTVKRSSSANTYSYAIYFPTGSQSNSCSENELQSGTTADIGDQSALTSLNSINGRVLLFNGNASSGTITLAADITLFAALEVQTGAVGTGNFSSSRAVPFSTNRRWNIATDRVTVRTINGKVDCSITNSTTLTISTANDAVRNIYGMAS